jgi:hypothetical protein
MSRRLAAWVCVLAALLGANAARAQQSTASGRRVNETAAAAARQHFDRGIALSDRGEISAAAGEFRRAYELVPHPSVLFNLGRAYSALGRHADAAATLRRYLRESTELEPSRRAQVANLLAFNAAKVGLLELKLEPPGAEVIVDGAPRARGPLTEPLELDVGAHGVLVMAPNHVPSFRTIELAAGQRVNLSLSLEPRGEGGAGQGQLIASCRVPSARVEVDGVVVGRTPLLPLLLPAGSHRVAFAREGYTRSEHQVVVPSSGELSVSCGLRLDPMPPATAARLRLSLLPPRARVTVNGEPFTGRPLPPGPHQLTVEHPDYEVWTDRVELAPASSQLLELNLQPTPSTRRRQASERSRTRRIWAAVAGGTGVLLVGTGTTVYLANTSRVDGWNRENGEVTSLLASGTTNQQVLDRNRRLQEGAAAIQSTDDLALGLAVSGGVALSLGLWLWLSDGAPASSASTASSFARPELRFTW